VAVALTTAVRADDADVAPAPLEAVTVKRILYPTLLAETKCLGPLTPAALRQLLPLLLQRCHVYRYFVGWPDHLPREAESSWPWTASPEIRGAATTRGR